MKPYDKNKLNSMFCDFQRKQKDIMNRTCQQQFIRIGAVVIAIDTVASIKFRGFGEADVILRNGRGFRIRGISKTQKVDTLYTLEKLNNAIKNN